MCQRQSKIVRKRQRNFVVFWRNHVITSSVSLFKKCIDDLLFLMHKFLAFFQPVRLTLDVDHGAMMQDAVQNGGSNGDIGKNLIPLGKSFVRGKDRRCLLIPSGDELEKQVGSLDIHREIADLVNDEHPVLGQDFEPVRQPVLKVGFLELLKELVAVDVVGRESVLRSYKT